MVSGHPLLAWGVLVHGLFCPVCPNQEVVPLGFGLLVSLDSFLSDGPTTDGFGQLFLMKCRMKVQVTIFLLSFLIRLAQIDFLPYLLQHIPIIDAFYNTLGVSVVDRNDAITLMETLRTDNNLVYSIRSEVIGIGLLMVLLGLRLKKIVFGPNFIYFMSLALTMATIANFEYIDITFYDRFFKVAVLFLAIAVFIAVAENKDLLNGRSIELITLIAIIFAFELVSQFVALRNAYLNPELWFGNFFTDWHGGLDENRMQMWGDLFR